MKRCLALMLFLLAPAHVAKADDLFNSLSGPSFGTMMFGNTSGPLAASFSTGASAFNFTSLTVALAAPETGLLDALLLSDASGSPGTELELIGNSPLGLQPTPREFTFGTPAPPFSLTLNPSIPSYTLAPRTRYWIELISDLNVNWSYTLDTSGTGVAGEFTAQTNFPNPAWVVVANDTVGPFEMGVAGTTVPEPNSFSLIACGLLGLAAVACWRRKEVA